MLDPSSAPMRSSARLTTDVSSCARKTPRHVVMRTTGTVAASRRRRGRSCAHAGAWGAVRSIGSMGPTSVCALNPSTRFASARSEALAVAIPGTQPHIENVSNVPQMAEVAALVGDPARANILCALLGGRALRRYARREGKLHAARLLVLVKQGRCRYYRLAGPHVAQMLESIMNVALAGPPRL